MNIMHNNGLNISANQNLNSYCIQISLVISLSFFMFRSREDLISLISKLEEQKDASANVLTSAETSRSATPCSVITENKAGR